jgi:uncharacterized protein YutE (UPF0331/DUF86 family)
MTPGPLRKDVVADRVSWVRKMVRGLRALPLTDEQAFLASATTVAAAESYLRRALEAMLDLGRHLLAKGLGIAVVEYRDIAVKLGENGVLDAEQTALMRDMAGYRNRMVHFYNEISEAELYDICAHRLGDIERTIDAIVAWIDSGDTT